MGAGPIPTLIAPGLPDPDCGETGPSGTGTCIGNGVGTSMFCCGRLRTRMSLRMRILMPWSASEHESGVDSAAYE